MILVSISSDRQLERKWHIIVCTALCGVFLLATPSGGRSELVGIVLCFALANGFFYGRFGPFWAFPSEVLPRQDVGVAIGMVAGIGNLGGFIGPYLFGYIRSATGSFSLALWLSGAMFILAGIVAAFIRPAPAAMGRRCT
jgi:nitrate/nitrite transporter NarK